MNVVLRPFVASDLCFLLEVRNHPQTLCSLHDQRHFSDVEAREWFLQTQPRWYLVLNDEEPVGYIRTSDWDDRNRTLKVGLDIHPKYRRRGFATAAYRQLFKELTNQGWVRIWLEVLPTNHAAISLYEQLGFETEGRLKGAIKRGNAREDSIVMGRLLCPDTNINAKVVAVYLGPRRAHPSTPKACHEMLKFLLDTEFQLRHGCPCDTLLVHNVGAPGSTWSDDNWTRKSEELLLSADGQSTQSGRIRLETRENIGLSFGAYHHAFEHHFQEYDYWLFTEDDQIMTRSGCFGRAIEQMKTDNTIGFVAVVGISPESEYPTHAHGGVGVSSRSILREVIAANPSDHHAYGHLPYHYETGYSQQESLGEIRFTNAIHQLGYRLVNHAWESICVSWGQPLARNPRMVCWSEDFRVADPQAQ